MNPVLKAIIGSLREKFNEDPAHFLSALEAALPMLKLAFAAQVLDVVLPDGPVQDWAMKNPNDAFDIIKALIALAQQKPDAFKALLEQVKEAF